MHDDPELLVIVTNTCPPASMPEKNCLKRRLSSIKKKKVILDDSSSSEDESLFAGSINARLQKPRSSNDSFLLLRKDRTEPSLATSKTPNSKTFTVDSLSSSDDDDDDSLLKPIVFTSRRRVTNSPTFLLRKAESPPSEKNNSHASGDSSVDTAELKAILLKPAPKPSAADFCKNFTPTTVPKCASPLETRTSYSHSRTNLKANDDSSEDTQELAKILLGEKYSPAPAMRSHEDPVIVGDRKLPAEIRIAPPPADASDSDHFELPEPEESSESSVASADSHVQETWKDQTLLARVPSLHANVSGVTRNPYQEFTPSNEANILNQKRYQPTSQSRSTPVNYNHDNTHNTNSASAVFVSQPRQCPPDPVELSLCDLREVALFDGSVAKIQQSKRSNTSQGKAYTSNNPDSHCNAGHEIDPDLQLEQAAFFDGSPCYGQLESAGSPTYIRTGLHSPRSTPFSHVPPAPAVQSDRDDFIQDYSDEETAVQRFGRLASRALEQKRQTLLQTAPSQVDQNEMDPMNRNSRSRRFRDASICDTAMSRAVVLREGGGNQHSGGWAPRNELSGATTASLVSTFTPAPQARGRGKGAKKRGGGWKGRGKWGKSKAKNQGGTRGRGRGISVGNAGFSTRTTSSSGGFSRGDDANLRHIGGAEFSF